MALSRILFSNLSVKMLYNVKEQINAEITPQIPTTAINVDVEGILGKKEG